MPIPRPKIFGKYSLKARWYPTVATIAPPLFIFTIFYAAKQPIVAFDYPVVIALEIFVVLALPLAGMFFLAQATRFLGEQVVEKFCFTSKQHMPATEFLLWKNTEYSRAFKVQIRRKMRRDFNRTFISSKRETENEEEARKIIFETMGQVRRKLEKDRMVLQCNIEYGAMRNLIGGAILGAALSAAVMIFFLFNWAGAWPAGLSAMLLVIYAGLLLSAKWQLNTYAASYARVLIRLYMKSDSVVYDVDE